MKAAQKAGVAAELKVLMLGEPKLTLAVAESLTAGNVQAQIAGVSGASGYFLGGVTAYSIEEKVRLLGVNRAGAKKVNCVSARVAEEMARGAAELFGADLAVATTGYAEPSVADGVVSPMAWWAIAHRRRGRVVKILSGRVECPGERRVAVQQIVAGAVLAELAAYLRVWRTSR
jgi:nicotinamide-nucleotide amidase